MQKENQNAMTRNSLTKVDVTSADGYNGTGVAAITIISQHKISIYHVPLPQLGFNEMSKIINADCKFAHLEVDAALAAWLFDCKFVPNYEILDTLEYLDYEPCDHGVYQKYKVYEIDNEGQDLRGYRDTWCRYFSIFSVIYMY